MDKLKNHHQVRNAAKDNSLLSRERWLRCAAAALLVTALALAATSHAIAAAADSKDSPAEKQRQLIRVLKSGAAPAEKALACKGLAIYGTKDAVPALARLLPNEELASWVRIALEAIPDPASDAALRKAMSSLHGRLLVGAINSIAVRRDSKAVKGLVKRLGDTNAEVASAAAIALGRIGGVKPAEVLEHALASAPEPVRPAVAQGCMLCGDTFSLQGKQAEAVKIYDAVRHANVPKYSVLEATRGAILARKSNGLVLLVEELRSPDKAFFGLGLRAARELSGDEVSEALVVEMKRAKPERQPLLLLAVSDRADSVSSSAVLEAAKSGPTRLRVVAIGALERQAKVSSVPVLLDAATAEDAEVAKTALGALTRLPGNEVNSDLLAHLPQASGKTRQVLIDLCARRRIDQALPGILVSTEDSDAGVRAAAVQAIGTLGNDQQTSSLVRLLQRTENAKEREDIEAALTAISTRSGSRCVPQLMPLLQADDSGLRLIALPVLAAAGGPEALAAVKSAVEDKDETVRDEAVRTLSTWPNNWPEDAAVLEPLRALAGDSQKPSYQVLALRGYLHFLEGDKQLKDGEKVAKVKEIAALIRRPDEQRLAIGVVATLPSNDALELLQGLAGQPDVSEEACKAMLKLLDDKRTAISKEARQQALATIVEKSKDDPTKQKAEDLIKAK